MVTWEPKRLGNGVLKVGHGKNQHEIETACGKYPILATGGVIGRSDTFLYDKPSVLIGRKGTIDKPQFMDTPFWTIDTLFYTMISQEYSPKYLYYAFCSIEWLKYNEASGVPSLSSKVIEDIELSFPPFSEQCAIAAVLSDMDAYIVALEKLIAKKLSVKQGAMQELLTGKRRLPGFTGEWIEKKLGEIGEIVTGSTPSTSLSEYWEGNILWVTPTDITDKKNIQNVERKISELGLSKIRELPPNSLLVTCIASIGKNAILRTRGASNQQINAIIPYVEYDVDFLYYLIEINKLLIEGKAGITATKIVSKTEFAEIELKFPQIKNEQIAIATVLSDMDSEIDALTAKIEKAKCIKQGMMSELLTGRIRLVEEETDNVEN